MIEDGLVYIHSIGTEPSFIGCGALIEGGYVATCRHVWDAAVRAPAGRAGVKVEYPRARKENGETIKSRVFLADACLPDACEGPPPDLVLLKPEAVPANIIMLQLAAREYLETGEGCTYAGLVGRDKSRPHIPLDFQINGKIANPTDAEGRRQFIGNPSEGYWPGLGSSGSPVFKDGGQQLAGIICKSELGWNEGKSQLRVALLVPATTIRKYLVRIVTAELQERFHEIRARDVPVTQIPGRLLELVVKDGTRHSVSIGVKLAAWRDFLWNGLLRRWKYLLLCMITFVIIVVISESFRCDGTFTWRLDKTQCNGQAPQKNTENPKEAPPAGCDCNKPTEEGQMICRITCPRR